MSQVSKYQMNQSLRERMFQVFYKTLADLKTEKQVEVFLHDLLSDTEQIMLAKRLSIAILLTKSMTFREIRDVLKVSTSTITTTRFWLESGGEGYKQAAHRIINQEEAEELIDSIDEKISNVIPPRRGTSWSNERSKQWKERRERKHTRVL